MSSVPKLVVILGPTASGKTDLALVLAKKYNGEIVSADSRQIYRELSISTAKPIGTWVQGVYEVEGVPYHLVDCVDTTAAYTVADFKRDALKAIQAIRERGKIPFLVGGTGLYISSIVDNFDIPAVVPNEKLRQSLESRPLSELQFLIKELDPSTAQTIDMANPRRLVRALEVVLLSGESFVVQQKKAPPLFEILQIGISWPRALLEARIMERLKKQQEQGFVPEVARVWKNYASAAWPSLSSIGYQPLVSYLSGETTLSEALQLIAYQTRQYARRQMTWFKRDPRIHWLTGIDRAGAESLVQSFLF